MTRALFGLLGLTCLMAVPGGASAADTETAETAAAPPPPPEVAVPYRQGAIQLDGDLDDEGWRNAAKFSLRARPLNLSPDAPVDMPGGTVVLVTYDADFLYVAFACQGRPGHIFGRVRDDELHRGDAVEVFIDGMGDRRQFFEIQVNPGGGLLAPARPEGVVRDVNHLFTGVDPSVDAQGMYTRVSEQWSFAEYDLRDMRHAVATLPDTDGEPLFWHVELALPAKELLRRSGERTLTPGRELRANFVRLAYPEGAGRPMRCMFWSETAFGRPHRSPGRFGRLVLQAPVPDETP